MGSGVGEGGGHSDALGRGRPGPESGPDLTPPPTLSPAVGAGCRPGETAPFLKGPDAASAPASRPVVGVRVACPSLSSSGKSQFSRLGCEVGRNQSRLPSPHLPPQVPRPGSGRCRPNSETLSPPSSSARRPSSGSALSTSPRPAPIGRLNCHSGHFLLGRNRRIKLWSGKKSHRRPAPDDPPFPPTPRHPPAAGNTPFSAAPDRIFLQLPRPVRFPP